MIVARSKKIIFFNGPARSGKDTAVKNLEHWLPFIHIKFSEPLKASLPIFFGLTQQEIDTLEETKDVPSDKFLGMSWRQAQISLSENWGKPMFGNAVFGKIALNKIQKASQRIAIISDSGFYEEASVLINHYGEENCLLVRCKRPGFTFEGDSRSYWEHSFSNLKEIIAYNGSTIEAYNQRVDQIVYDWLHN